MDQYMEIVFDLKIRVKSKDLDIVLNVMKESYIEAEQILRGKRIDCQVWEELKECREIKNLNEK